MSMTGVEDSVDKVPPLATIRMRADGRLLDVDAPEDFVLFENPAALSGFALTEVFPPEVCSEINSGIRTVLENECAHGFQFKVPHSGGLRTHEACLVPGCDGEVFLVLQDLTERQRAEERLLHSQMRLRSLAGRLELVREQERKRIAREVHDVLGQALTALRIDVASLQKNLSEDQNDLQDRLGLMNSSIGSIIQKVRRIAADLRPGVLDDLGIVAALEWQADEFASRTGIGCTFHSSESHLELDPDRSTALFRVYQEVLTNVARHAEASAVGVALKLEGDDLILRVNDNGCGISEDQITDTNSLGILGMRERMLPWQGRVEFDGTPDHGTSVTITLPIGDRKDR